MHITIHAVFADNLSNILIALSSVFFNTGKKWKDI